MRKSSYQMKAVITNTDGSIQTLSVSENSSDIETSVEVGVEIAHTTIAN